MGFTKREPNKPLTFHITKQHCSLAKRNDPCECVIAQAFKSKYGKALLAIHVLPNVTTLLFDSGKVRRYRTPAALKTALGDFDKTGKWPLEEGNYKLLPLPPSQRAAARRQQSEERREAGKGKGGSKYKPTGRLKNREINARNINLAQKRERAGV